MSGPPVQLGRAARRPPLGRGDVLDPPPRERPRLREADRGGRVGAGALARGAARRSTPRSAALTRVALQPSPSSGPPGPTPRRRCSPRREGEVEAVACATVYETVMAVQEGRDRPRRRADRELARGRRGRHARRARGRGGRRADRGRGGPPDPPLPDRRARRSSSPTIDARALPPPGHGAVRRASCASACPAPSSCPPPPPPRRCAPCGTPASRGPRSARGCPPSSTAARCSPSGSRTARQPDPLRLAGAGRRAGAAGRRPAPRPRSSSGASTTRRPGALVDVLSEFSGPRHQPHQDRVAPAAGAPRATTCSSPTSRATSDEPHVAEALEALGKRVETLRVLGSLSGRLRR